MQEEKLKPSKKSKKVKPEPEINEESEEEDEESESEEEEEQVNSLLIIILFSHFNTLIKVFIYCVNLLCILIKASSVLLKKNRDRCILIAFFFISKLITKHFHEVVLYWSAVQKGLQNFNVILIIKKKCPLE